MTNHELLCLSAKVSGLNIEWSDRLECHYITGPCELWKPWRPLDDDGDAMRLAVSLKLDLTFYNGFQEVHADPSNSDGLSPSIENYGDDICAAVRRAIVRAAAEIGRTTP